MKTQKPNINKFSPCPEAVRFYNNYTSFEEAWNNCPRGDWMLWIAQQLNVNIHTLTLAKALCAETVIHLMKDKRSIQAVKTAKKFGRYKATKKELDAATATNKEKIMTTELVLSMFYATYAAYATDAYAAAAYAAYATAYATDAYAAKKENQLKTANICRKILTKTILSKVKKL